MVESKENHPESEYTPIWWESRFLPCIEAVYVIEAAVNLFNAHVPEGGRTISTTRVYKRKHDHPQFALLLEQAREKYLDGLEAKVLQSGENNASMALVILERLRPNKWAAPEKRVKLMGDPDAPLQMQSAVRIKWADTDVVPDSLPDLPESD